MDVNLICRPSNTVAEVTLQPGESIIAEAGAMTWMDPCVRLKPKLRGGLWSAFNGFIAGESWFQSYFSSPKSPGMVALAPGAPGDLIVLELQGEELVLERGAFLASEPGVHIDAKWGGLFGFS